MRQCLAAGRLRRHSGLPRLRPPQQCRPGSRRKGKFTIWQDSELHQLTLLITAAPARYQRKPVAIVIVEDISLISELSGLLPICSSCHKIRDDQGEWIPVERYIREKSEAEFTHDYCPTCTAALRRSEPR
jgi:hypothetical protein